MPFLGLGGLNLVFLLAVTPADVCPQLKCITPGERERHSDVIAAHQELGISRRCIYSSVSTAVLIAFTSELIDRNDARGKKKNLPP